MNSSAANGPTDETGFRDSLETSLGRVDQGVTAHSYLRDKLSRRSTVLSSVIIMAAAVVTVLATSSDAVKSLFLLSTPRADQIIGLAGLIVLLLSILELKVAWRERSSRHAEAASSLSRLKLLIARELGSDLVLTKARYMELHQAYEDVNDLITKIPESKFLELKAIHKRKVEMSHFLDRHPGSSIILLRIKIWLRDNLTNWPRKS